MNSNRRKEIVDTYNTIYSVDIVVAKNIGYKKLNKYYSYSTGEDLEESIENSVATTAKCIRRSDNKPVVLILWNKDLPSYKVDHKKGYMINTMAHEATHAAIDIWDYIGEYIDANHSEPVAYFIGWVTECIYKTITKK